MFYACLKLVRTFKDGLSLVARDEDLVEMCRWVTRFKVTEFYTIKREAKSIYLSKKFKCY